jgi:hypothetical protein
MTEKDEKWWITDQKSKIGKMDFDYPNSKSQASTSSQSQADTSSQPEIPTSRSDADTSSKFNASGEVSLVAGDDPSCPEP